MLVALCSFALANCVQAQRSIDVTFKSGDATLEGTLHLPSGKGPFPVLISVHGSGPGARGMPFYDQDKDLFVPEGIAVFLYDKRGFGKSTGLLQDFDGLHPLIEDVHEAIKAMRARPEINPKLVGLKGLSQGGWVATMAAAKDPELAFVISVAGPGVDNNEQTIYQRGQVLLDRGLPLQVVEQANALRRVVWGYYATGEGYEQAVAAWDKAKQEPWFDQAGFSKTARVTAPADLAKPELAYFRTGRFDMVSIISSLKVPVLSVFGTKDRLIPVLDSIASWERGMELGNLKDATIKLYQDGGHGINLVKEEYPRVQVGEDHEKFLRKAQVQLVPEYVQFVKAWVKERTKAK
jgi:pimeloyl-ACP methyl ester carboxylesterase